MSRILQDLNLKPDVYLREFDNSALPSSAIGTRKAVLFYGWSTKGVCLEPTLIKTTQQFTETFGTPDLSKGVEKCHGTWTAYDYLSSGAGDIYFIRLIDTANTSESDLTAKVQPKYLSAKVTSAGVADSTFTPKNEVKSTKLRKEVTLNATSASVVIASKLIAYDLSSVQNLLVSIKPVTNYSQYASSVDLTNSVKVSELNVYNGTEVDETYSIVGNEYTIIGSFVPGIQVGESTDRYITQVANLSTTTSESKLTADVVGFTNGTYFVKNGVVNKVVSAIDSTTIPLTSTFTSAVVKLKFIPLAETYVVSNTRGILDSGKSLFIGDIISRKSKLIEILFSDLYEDDSIALLFPVSGSTITFGKYATDIVKVTDFGANSIYQDISSVKINIKNTPIFRVFQHGFASNQYRPSAVVTDNQYMVGIVNSVAQPDYQKNGIVSNTESAKQLASRIWSYDQCMRVFDPFTKKNWFLPVTTQVIKTMGFLKDTPWIPIAGVGTGNVASTKVVPEYSDDEIGTLYNEQRVNLIDATSRGYFIWGNRTSFKDASKLDRIHSVGALIEVESALYDSLKGFIFKTATANTLSNIYKTLQRMREFYLNEGACSIFEFEIDTSLLAYNQLNINVKIKPIDVIEFIDVSVSVTNESVTITESVG